MATVHFSADNIINSSWKAALLLSFLSNNLATR